MTDKMPDGYVQTIEAMQRAAIAWLKQHPFATLRFKDIETEVAREAGRPGQRVAIAAALPTIIDRWADSADARSLLWAMEAASQGEGTYLQAKAILDDFHAQHLERASGQLPTSGDWRCAACRKLIDGFTNAEGGPGVPGPGSVSVCAYCGSLQRVNDEGNGFVPLSTRELNRLPTSARKTLMIIKRTVEERLERERSRS